MRASIKSGAEIVPIRISPSKAERMTSTPPFEIKAPPAEPTLALPGVPTMAEAASLPGYESLVWYGFVVPEGTPANIVQRLNREVAQAAAVPRVTEAVQKLGFEIAPSSPEAFDEQMRVEAERATQAKQANQP